MMVSNIIKLSLGSLLFFLFVACLNEHKVDIKVSKKSSLPDSCKYYADNARQLVSNLSCYSCHIRGGGKLNEIPSFDELAAMDSLKLINYVFIKKHNGDYNVKGAFKTSQMDTLSDCDINNVIRYIKDYGRNIPMPSQ